MPSISATEEFFLVPENKIVGRLCSPSPSLSHPPSFSLPPPTDVYVCGVWMNVCECVYVCIMMQFKSFASQGSAFACSNEPI